MMAMMGMTPWDMMMASGMCGKGAMGAMGCGGCKGGGCKGGGGGSSPAAKPGDWICPNCGDLVFARRTECKMCGTPNPGGPGMALGGGGGAGGGGAAAAAGGG